MATERTALLQGTLDVLILKTLATGAMHAEAMAHQSLRSAMAHFEAAEELRKPGNDDAILRWNTCARTLQRLREDEEYEGQFEPQFGE